MKKIIEAILLCLISLTVDAQTFTVNNLQVNGTTTLTSPLTVANGGTNAATASGTALDNITGFGSTGFLTRTGAGAYSFQSTTNGITFGNIAQTGANTLLGNSTSGTANIASQTVPNCSTSSSALNWTTNTGIGCNSSINAATLLGSTWASPAAIGSTTPAAGSFTTITASSTITPSQTAGIVGTTTNNNANAGSVGEYVTNTTSGTSLSNNVNANATSVSLTAGDWDVSCAIQYNPAGTTTFGALTQGISTTSATFGAFGTSSRWSLSSFTTGSFQVMVTPTVRISLSGTTTTYCVVQAGFGTSTMTVDGFIRARRIR